MLTEEEVRAKVIELLDRMSLPRLNLWAGTGVLTGVLDSKMVERIMEEEIGQRRPEVQQYWMAPCDICGPLDECGHTGG